MKYRQVRFARHDPLNHESDELYFVIYRGATRSAARSDERNLLIMSGEKRTMQPGVTSRGYVCAFSMKELYSATVYERRELIIMTGRLCAVITVSTGRTMKIHGNVGLWWWSAYKDEWTIDKFNPITEPDLFKTSSVTPMKFIRRMFVLVDYIRC